MSKLRVATRLGTAPGTHRITGGNALLKIAVLLLTLLCFALPAVALEITRNETKDSDLQAMGSYGPYGMWSDGTMMSVGDTWGDNPRGSNGRHKVLAYNMDSKDRDKGKDFDSLSPAGLPPLF